MDYNGYELEYVQQKLAGFYREVENDALVEELKKGKTSQTDHWWHRLFGSQPAKTSPQLHSHRARPLAHHR